MYIYDDDHYFSENENRIAFLIDSESDLAYLPNTTQSGDPTKVWGGGNVMIEPVDAGSMAHSIATSKDYILNSRNQWKEFKRPGGGSTPTPVPTVTSLAELTDVQLGSLADGDFLVYNETLGKWKNGSAETVVVNYEAIENPPTINGVVLTPTTTLEELGIAPAPTYDDPTETIGL